MLPYLIAGGAVVANGVKDIVIKIADGEVIKNYTDVVENIANTYNTSFSQNYCTKRLSLELSRNYTTDTKNLEGSILPNLTVNNSRLDQIERLINATLNQSKYRG